MDAPQKSSGSALKRAAAGVAGAAIVLASVTFIGGPLGGTAIQHDNPLGYEPDRKGRIEVPFEVTLEEERPEVVVLGSSIVACAFDAKEFSRLTGRASSDLTIAGGMSATWYLIIKNVLTKAPERPKFCVLGFRDSYLTVPEHRVGGAYRRIIDRYVDGPEPLLDRYAYLNEINDFDYVLRQYWAPIQRRSALRDELEGWAKERLAGKIVGREPAEMRSAVDVVFAADRKIPSKLTKKQRIAEVLTAGNYFDFDAELRTSFLPEMIRICEENGIQLILVRMRLRRNAEFPNDRSHFPRPLLEDLPRYSEDLDEYLKGHSVTLVDFAEDERIPFAWFAEGDHLNLEEGRDGFTRLLADEFIERFPLPD